MLEYPENIKKLVSKLPFHLHDKWRNLVHRTRDSHQPIKFNLLARFVKEEAKKANDPVYGRDALSAQHKQGAVTKYQVRQIMGPVKPKSTFAGIVKSQDSSPTNKVIRQNKTVMEEKVKYCLFCKQSSHVITECRKFESLNPPEKVKFVKDDGLCFGCLRKGHQKKFCGTKSTCTKCNFSHPSVVHYEKENTSSINEESKVVETLAKSPSTHGTVHPSSACSAYNENNRDMGAGEGDVTMAIVPVNVRLKDSVKVIQTYAFLDTGSNVSFCTEKLLNELGGSGKKMKLTLNTMGTTHTFITQQCKGLKISNLNSDYVVKLPCVYTKNVMPVTHDHIPVQGDIDKWEHLNDVKLPYINCADIGLLIGNNVPDAYTPLSVRTGPPNSPHATLTSLGWVVWNVIREVNTGQPLTVNRADVLAISQGEELKQLDQFVRQSMNRDFPERQIDDVKQPSQEDLVFLNKVHDSMKLVDGHYQLKLPFRNEAEIMPNNEDQALKRLTGIKRKMMANERFYNDYADFMNKLLLKGYAEKVPNEEIDRNDGKVWYIPHHGVYHPNKPEKIRVVFDCTANYQGVSLNNKLLPGPDHTNNLVAVLLRFRQEPIAIMGDIESIFYQVKVDKSHCDYLRFFWWPNGDLTANPVAYRMLVHLYGAVSSPSVANAALQKTARDQKSFGPEVSEVVHKNFYVDDCLKSVGTEDEAIKMINDVSELCKSGGFRLTKWLSNSRKVLMSVPEEERATNVKYLDFDHDQLPMETALGVCWSVDSDTFGFKINIKDQPSTKRGILSTVSSIYDLLGLAAPFILPARILLQELFRRSLDWDETINDTEFYRWQQWLEDLPKLEHLKLNRHYKPSSFGEKPRYQLHNFCDASETGYGVVTYLRMIDSEERIHCSLVMSKARVAPLKKVTIPRLELTAASVAVRLNKMILSELDFEIDQVFFWTDSMSVLKYLHNEKSRFHTFVANRISFIREATTIEIHRYKAKSSRCCLSRIRLQRYQYVGEMVKRS